MIVGNINALKPANWADLPREIDPVLEAWKAAVANRLSHRADIVIMGPATVEGYPTTDFNLVLAQQLGSRLRKNNPTNGLANLGKRGGRGRIGVPTPGMTPPIPTPFIFTAGTFDPTTSSGTPTLHRGANHMSWYTNVSGQKVAFAMKADESSFDLVLGTGPTGHATAGWYTIDGGSHVPFSTYAADNTIEILNVSVPENAEIEIGCSGSGYLILAEIIVYADDSGKGIMVHGVGRSGCTCQDWILGADTEGGWRESIANLSPNLLIIEAGIDDASVVTASEFGGDLTVLIETLRAGNDPLPIVPILITAPYDSSSEALFLDPWSAYVSQMKAIADADPMISFFNYGDLMPRTNAAQTHGYYHTDLIHGSADGKGYAFMAECLANHLPNAIALPAEEE